MEANGYVALHRVNGKDSVFVKAGGRETYKGSRRIKYE